MDKRNLIVMVKCEIGRTYDVAAELADLPKGRSSIRPPATMICSPCSAPITMTISAIMSARRCRRSKVSATPTRLSVSTLHLGPGPLGDVRRRDVWPARAGRADRTALAGRLRQRLRSVRRAGGARASPFLPKRAAGRSIWRLPARLGDLRLAFDVVTVPSKPAGRADHPIHRRLDGLSRRKRRRRRLCGTDLVIDLTVEGLMHAPETAAILKSGARIMTVSTNIPRFWRASSRSLT